jgi:uncharacterized protein YndB with AHSA1/START domain
VHSPSRNRTVAGMSAVERHLTLPAHPAVAWELLTDPGELVRWLGAEVELPAEPGAPGLVVDHDGTRRRLVVDEVDAARRLAWHWAVEEHDGRVGPVSRVEITLTADDDGTRVHVTEAPVEQGPTTSASASAAASGAGEAWSHRLLHLEALLLVAAAIRG